MRSNSALYVDAGYLIAAAATRLTGSSLRRGVKVDYERLITDLVAEVEKRSGLPLLRVYWYDAGRRGIADAEQERIALLPRVKLRLGRVGVDGEQKGVDLRIALDMLGHSRNAAVDTMFLLSGDDDLTEAVEEVQAAGVQVVVLAIPSANGDPYGVSRHLVRAADGLDVIQARMMDEAVSPVATGAAPADSSKSGAAAEQITVPTPADLARRVPNAGVMPLLPIAPDGVGPQPAVDSAPLAHTTQREAPEVTAIIRTVVWRTYEAWSTTATPAQRDELANGRPSIPRDLDRALLVDLSGALGDDTLADPVRVELRARFWELADLNGPQELVS